MDQSQLAKGGEVLVEEKIHIASGAMPMLGYHDFGDVFALRFGFVHVLPVDKHDDIGILFDRTTFTKITQLWSFFCPGFYLPAELGESDHRYLKLSGQLLERAGYEADLLDAIFRSPPPVINCM